MIRRLRALELPLEEVRAVLAADPGEQRQRLIAHRARVEQRMAAATRILDELSRLIDGKEDLVPEPADVLNELKIKAYDALSRWIAEQDLETAGPPREIYWTDPQNTFDPADYVTEIAWPVVPDRGKLERIGGLRGREAHETGDRLKESAGSSVKAPPSSGRSVLK